MAMRINDAGNSRWKEPLRVWIVVLTTLFITEACVMEFMPWIVPATAPRLVATFVDALLLTSVAAPVLWLLLVRPLQEASRMRTQFLDDLFSSIEADRRRIAHDLHDGVGQLLTLLISGLRTAAPQLEDHELGLRCQQLREIANEALVDVKRLALGLRPSLLDDLGLEPALQRIVSDFRQHHALDIELDSDQLGETRLPEAMETSLYRITQEALANIAKHAHATHVRITLRRDMRGIELRIEDDGIGIAPSKLSGSNPGHMGITGMRERVVLIGGKLFIGPVNGKGTQLLVQIPVRR